MACHEFITKYLFGKKCAICKKEADKRCSQCKTVYYCSPTCQTKDWPSHKSICAKVIEKASDDNTGQQQEKSYSGTVRALLLPEDSTEPQWVDVPCQYNTGDDPRENVFYKYPNYAIVLGGDGVKYTSRRHWFSIIPDIDGGATKEDDFGTFTMYFRAKANADLPCGTFGTQSLQHHGLRDPNDTSVDTSGTKLNKCAQAIGTTYKWHGPLLVMESVGSFIDPDPERKYVDLQKEHAFDMHKLKDFLMHEKVWDF